MQIWCDCEEKGNANKRAQSLLKLLSIYSPDVKVVLVLAAVAECYGDVMVIMNQQTNKGLKELIGTFPGKSTSKLKKDMKATVNNILGVVHFIMELKGFQTWEKIITESHINETILSIVTAVIHCGFTVSEFYRG